MDQGVIRLLEYKSRTCIIKTIINAIGKRNTNAFNLYTWSYENTCSFLECSLESTIINCFFKAGFKEGVSDEDDDPFCTFKSSIDQLWQRDENLIPNDFTYKNILTIDDDIAVMGGVMTDEEIVQDLIEVANEEVQEEDKEVTDETITKPTTKEICKATDTLVDFLMFTQSGEIGTIALKAAKMF